VRDERRTEHPDADDVKDPRDACARDLLRDDDLLDRAEPLAAELLRPRRSREAAFGELALPDPPRGDDLVLVSEGARTLENGRLALVFLQPGAHLRPVLGLFGRVVEVHEPSSWLTD
jgi:hypothetical protein